MRNRETMKLMEKFVKLYKIKNYIRECGDIGVTDINKNSSDG